MGKITDLEILAWILGGVLTVHELQAERPQLIFRNRLLKPYLNRQGGKRRIQGACRWRWQLRHTGRQRSIVCSKLVWMFVNRSLVPKGYVIHHLDKGSLYDGINNLELMSEAAHLEYHYGAF